MQTIRAGIPALVGSLLLSSVSLAPSWALSPTGESDGVALYQAHCAHCHEGQVKRAPHRDVMSRLRTPRRFQERPRFGQPTRGSRTNTGRAAQASRSPC